MPVIRSGRIVAILGVGNKRSDYLETDVRMVSEFADLAWDIAEKKRAEEEIKEREFRLNLISSNLPGAIYQYRMEPDGSFSMPYLSEGAEKIFDRPISDLTNPESMFSDIHPEDAEPFRQSIKRASDGASLWSHEFRVITPKGETKWLRASANPKRLGNGAIVWNGVILEITYIKRAEEETKRLQDQLLQAQKMESIGRLAGGVAHDFNNMLGIIIGSTEIALMDADPEDPLRETLESIQKAAHRSADLTRQLLAFARKQTYTPRVLDINETIEGMLKMLGRLIGENIRLDWEPGHDIFPVKMDPIQLDQILANLCVNTRDAIKDTGVISIKTENIVLERPEPAMHPGVETGKYLLMSVSDTGCGMNKEVLDKLFEPFFATKEVGLGTGLGLATVYGIIKQNGGFINVKSSPGKGAVFNIYIPAHLSQKESEPEASVPSRLKLGTDMILLVEDDSMMLEMGRMMLERLGYSVITASSTAEALESAERHGTSISLLITDLVMPEMNGKELSEKISGIIPGIRKIFISGYPANVLAPYGILADGLDFIEKAFTLKNLSEKVADALGKNVA